MKRSPNHAATFSSHVPRPVSHARLFGFINLVIIMADNGSAERESRPSQHLDLRPSLTLIGRQALVSSRKSIHPSPVTPSSEKRVIPTDFTHASSVYERLHPRSRGHGPNLIKRFWPPVGPRDALDRRQSRTGKIPKSASGYNGHNPLCRSVWARGEK